MAQDSKDVPASLSWLPIYMIGAVFLALAWTHWAYRFSHLEWQGIDILNHAIMVHEVGRSDGPRPQALGGHVKYPMLSHRLAAAALPWFDGDAILALRFLTWVAIFWTYGLQLALLRRYFQWPEAILTLATIQIICVYFMVGTFNHTMGQGQYNYSRLVSAVGFWASLLLLSLTPSRPWMRAGVWSLALATAAFAFQCHLAPGLPALATVGCLGLCIAIERRNWWYLLASFSSLFVLATLIFFSNAWKYMAENSGAEGWLPVRAPLFLAAWVLVAGVVAARWLRRSRTGADQDDPTLHWERVVGAGLLGAGLFQALLTYRLVNGYGASYSVKSLFSLTVSLALMLIVFWAARLYRLRNWDAFGSSSPNRSRLVWGLSLVVLTFHVADVRRLDLGLQTQINVARGDDEKTYDRVRPGVESLPGRVVRRLGAEPHEVGTFYFDPRQPVGSFFVNIVALDQEREICGALLDLRGREKFETAMNVPGVRELWLPLEFGSMVSEGCELIMSEGADFYRCRKRERPVVPATTVGRRPDIEIRTSEGEPR